MGIFPIACAASTWSRAPAALVSSPASSMGCMVPISLFAAIRDTKDVGFLRASLKASRLAKPSDVTGRISISKPSSFKDRADSKTHLCSKAKTSTRLTPSPIRARKRAAPIIARLLDSVAPDVKTISLESAPISLASFSRAASTANSAFWPNWCCVECGLPKS